MKVVHICLSCFYIDGYSYQENILVRKHVELGHDVTVIASTENYDNRRKLTYVEPSTYIGGDGATVMRIPYRNIINHSISKKLRVHNGLNSILKELQPDIVMFHGLCGWELKTVVNFCKKRTSVKLYIDSHEDHNNSARSFISKNLLHRLYYKNVIQSCLKDIDKILCISLDVKKFVSEFYGVPNEKLDFFPLGGEVFSDQEYNLRRFNKRCELNVNNENLIFFQSGKFNQRKKIIQSLEAFINISDSNSYLFLAGDFDEEVRSQCYELIESHERIVFLGWQDSNEIRNLLCAADVYVQPGTQSATMQMSICARCVVIIDNVLSHVPFVQGNGYLLDEKRTLEDAFSELISNKDYLENMSNASLSIAYDLVDYNKLARRIVE
ncbi:glycosyltransferase family 4 protein [Vibrio splendidus]